MVDTCRETQSHKKHSNQKNTPRDNATSIGGFWRIYTEYCVGVNVNIDIEAEERRNELLRERIRMTRELLDMEKELSQIRSQQ